MPPVGERVGGHAPVIRQLFGVRNTFGRLSSFVRFRRGCSSSSEPPIRWGGLLGLPSSPLTNKLSGNFSLALNENGWFIKRPSAQTARCSFAFVVSRFHRLYLAFSSRGQFIGTPPPIGWIGQVRIPVLTPSSVITRFYAPADQIVATVHPAVPHFVVVGGRLFLRVKLVSPLQTRQHRSPAKFQGSGNRSAILPSASAASAREWLCIFLLRVQPSAINLDSSVSPPQRRRRLMARRR